MWSTAPTGIKKAELCLRLGWAGWAGGWVGKRAIKGHRLAGRISLEYQSTCHDEHVTWWDHPLSGFASEVSLSTW